MAHVSDETVAREIDQRTIHRLHEAIHLDHLRFQEVGEAHSFLAGEVERNIGQLIIVYRFSLNRMSTSLDALPVIGSVTFTCVLKKRPPVSLGLSREQ